MKRIGLDAGHGTDSANGVPGLKEFDFTSSVVAIAKPWLERCGFFVSLLQPLNGVTTPLADRTDKAFSDKCDFIVSVHADANPNVDARGHWIFHWHNNTMGKSYAEIWNKHAKAILPNPSRGIWACGPTSTWPNFHMVRVPASKNIPAVLIEWGFMTNKDDLSLLQSVDFRRKCAEVLVRSMCEYYRVQYKEEVEPVKTDYDNHFAKDDINFLMEQGILAKTVTYRPNDTISRGEVAAVLARVVRLVIKLIANK